MRQGAWGHSISLQSRCSTGKVISLHALKIDSAVFLVIMSLLKKKLVHDQCTRSTCLGFRLILCHLRPFCLGLLSGHNFWLPPHIRATWQDDPPSFPWWDAADDFEMFMGCSHGRCMQSPAVLTECDVASSAACRSVRSAALGMIDVATISVDALSLSHARWSVMTLRCASQKPRSSASSPMAGASSSRATRPKSRRASSRRGLAAPSH